MGENRRRVPTAVAVVTIALTALLTVVGVVPSAVAASVPEAPTASWYPWMACDGSSGNCAQVRAITTTPDGRTWLGGAFSQLRSPDGKQSLARANVAALNADGTPATAVAGHTFNGTVFALETDGTNVFAGGAFTKVDGVGVQRLVAFSAATGARVTTFGAGVNGTVYAAELYDGKLYLGGKFTAVQGATRNNLAAVSSATGAVDPSWTPSATLIANDAYPNDAAHNNVPIRTIVAAGEQNRIYVGGDMDLLNGVARPTVGAVDPVTGVIDTTFAVSTSINKTFQGMQLAYADSTGGRVPGLVVAMGGLTNRAVKLRATGQVAWSVNTDGDVQAAAVIGNSVYLGGHFVCVSTIGCYDASTTGDADRMHIAAFQYDATSNPPADPSWAPYLGPTWSPYYYGVWTLHASGGSLYAGGVFNTVNVGDTTTGLAKFVRFGDLPSPPPTTPPTTTPPTTTPPTTPPPTTPPAAGTLFSDDFSTGTMGAWDSAGGGFSVVNGAARATTTGKIATASKNLGVATTTMTYAFDMTVTSLDPSKRVVLARMTRTTAPTNIVGLYVNSNGTLGYRNEHAGSDRNSSVRITTGETHRVVLQVAVSGDTSTVAVSLDGTPVGALTRTDDLGTDPLTGVQLGDSAGGKTYTIDYDAVLVSDPSVPATTAPPTTSTTTSTTAPPTTTTTTAPPTTTTTTTTTAPPTTTTSTTAAPTVPANAVFTEDFSSGSFAGWDSSGRGFSVADGVATGTATGRIATASKALPAPLYDVRYSFRVDARSLDPGKRVVLGRLTRTGAPTNVVSLYVNSDGTFGYRNEVAGADRNGGVVLDQDWHTITISLHVDPTDAAAGQVQVLVDGVPAPLLTRTDDLGTLPLTGVQLGDSGGGKTYTIDFDDVWVAPLP